LFKTLEHHTQGNRVENNVSFFKTTLITLLCLWQTGLWFLFLTRIKRAFTLSRVNANSDEGNTTDQKCSIHNISMTNTHDAQRKGISSF